MKEQVNNYMSAVEGLNHGTDSDEIKQYEKKLVAVSNHCFRMFFLF